MGLKGSLNILLKKAYSNRANIEFVSGTILTMVGTGLFIRATHKNYPNIQDYQLKKEIISKNDTERKKEITKEVVKETVKNYAIPTAVQATGYALQICSNVQQNKDLAKLNAAVTTLSLAYNALRERYIAENGDEAWAKFNGVTTEETVDVETGEITEETIFDKTKLPLYSVIFDEANRNFEKSKGANRRFIQAKLRQAQSDLATYRLITFHDILKNYLGYSLVPGEYFSAEFLEATANAGWYYGSADSPTEYIDFGLDRDDNATIRFMQDLENSIWLEFNCYPNVYEVMKKASRRNNRRN